MKSVFNYKLNIDVFVLARLSSSRLPKKHLKEIIGKPAIHHLIHRIKKARKYRKIVICTTNLSADDELVQNLKQENIEVFRGDSEDVLKRIVDAAEYYNTDVVIDIEGDKIYTDPKYIDIISDEFKKSNIDYATGNDSLKKFNPSHGIHGIIPAGMSVKALKQICNIKKNKNTETGYKEFFTRNKFKTKFIVPDNINKFPKNLRLFLDYPEDLEMAKQIFKEIGNDFDLNELLSMFEKKPELLEITKNVVNLWLENYQKNKTEYSLD